MTYVSLDEWFKYVRASGSSSAKWEQPQKVNTECLREVQVIDDHNNVCYYFPVFPSYLPSKYLLNREEAGWNNSHSQITVWDVVIGCSDLGSLKLHETAFVSVLTSAILSPRKYFSVRNHLISLNLCATWRKVKNKQVKDLCLLLLCTNVLHWIVL